MPEKRLFYESPSNAYSRSCQTIHCLPEQMRTSTNYFPKNLLSSSSRFYSRTNFPVPAFSSSQHQGPAYIDIARQTLLQRQDKKTDKTEEQMAKRMSKSACPFLIKTMQSSTCGRARTSGSQPQKGGKIVPVPDIGNKTQEGNHYIYNYYQNKGQDGPAEDQQPIGGSPLLKPFTRSN